MKNLLYISLLSASLFSCNKESSNLDTTPTLEVEKKNMGVYASRTATWCGPCGGSLYNTHDVYNNLIGYGVAMSFKDAFSEGQAPYANNLFDKVAEAFDLPNSVPTSFQNFSSTSTPSINEHLEDSVVVSGNYELTFNGNEMTINTTTKFFKEFYGDVYIAPYIIVDSLVGYQNGNPDGANTVHNRYTADIAYPSTKEEDSKFEWGYLVSAGEVKNGHTVNLQFKAQKASIWQNKNISIGLIYFKKVGSQFVFMNAFTK